MSIETPDTSSNLTLGALFHHLRGGVGDLGSTQVSIRFEQRSSVGSMDASQGGVPTSLTKSSLRAELDFHDQTLHRADMMATASSRPGAMRVSFIRDDQGFLYSAGGVKFGRFGGEVNLFDIGSFEQMLSFVTVHDVTIDERHDARGASLNILDVDVDNDGFTKLLAIFGSDSEDAPDDYDLDSYSVNLTAGGDLVVDYWWQLSGEEGSSPATVNCHVTLRLSAAPRRTDARVPVDESMPVLTSIDDVWDVARTSPT